MVAVFHGRSYISGTADAQHPLGIHIDTVIVAKIIVEPSVPFIRALLVDLFNLVSQTFIFFSSAAQLPRNPFVVGGASHMEQSADRFNGKTLFLMALFNGYVNMTMSYF